MTAKDSAAHAASVDDGSVDAADLKRKLSKVIPIKRIRKELRNEIESALDSMPAGQFTIDMRRDAIKQALRPLNLNDYKDDLIEQIERVEDEARTHRVQLSLNTELFTQELAEKAWLPLGEGVRVRVSDANWAHIVIKHEAQIRQHDLGAAAIAKSAALMDVVRPIMEPDPTVQLKAAMSQLGLW